MGTIYKIIRFTVLAIISYLVLDLSYEFIFPYDYLTSEIKVPKNTEMTIRVIIYLVNLVLLFILYNLIDDIIKLNIKKIMKGLNLKLFIRLVIFVISFIFTFVIIYLLIIILAYLTSYLFGVIINLNYILIISILFSIILSIMIALNYNKFKFSNKVINMLFLDDTNKIHLIDTSALIDGRVIHLYDLGLLSNILIVGDYVLKELHLLSDSSDEIKKSKGRRGLEVYQKLKKSVAINNDLILSVEDNTHLRVDDKLIEYLKENDDVELITTDYNLTEVCKINDLRVININELMNILKKELSEDDIISITISKKGSSRRQGLGNLEDGSLVIVEDADELIGELIECKVNKIVYKPSGRIIFCDKLE